METLTRPWRRNCGWYFWGKNKKTKEACVGVKAASRGRLINKQTGYRASKPCPCYETLRYQASGGPEEISGSIPRSSHHCSFIFRWGRNKWGLALDHCRAVWRSASNLPTSLQAPGLSSNPRSQNSFKKADSPPLDTASRISSLLKNL